MRNEESHLKKALITMDAQELVTDALGLSNSPLNAMAAPDEYPDSQVDKPALDPELSNDEDADNAEVAHTIESGQASGSNRKKKKKKSKAKKIIDALDPTNMVPQAVLEKVVDKVKEDGLPGSENIEAEDVRQVLQQIKIRDVLKGKTGIAGNNRKDVGEHKVCFSVLDHKNQSPYIAFSSGVHNPCRNWVWTSIIARF